MKKIGFIDYYIDEWHANNYPAWIRQSSFKDRFDVVLAWEEMTPAGKKSIDQWCQEQKVQKAASLEAVVEECDCVVVLSPDNGERHEDLADIPLRSGKPVYIDKPLALSVDAAKRLFAKAGKYSTPMMSSSALRFSASLNDAICKRVANEPVHFVQTRGGGIFNIYAIHQLEMLVMMLGTGAKQVMQCGNNQSSHMVIDYGDGRRGAISLIPGHEFQVSAQFGDGKSLALNTMNTIEDFFYPFIDGMLGFFETGISPIRPEETVEIIALIDAGIAGLANPDKWVLVPK